MGAEHLPRPSAGALGKMGIQPTNIDGARRVLNGKRDNIWVSGNNHHAFLRLYVLFGLLYATLFWSFLYDFKMF